MRPLRSVLFLALACTIACTSAGGDARDFELEDERAAVRGDAAPGAPGSDNVGRLRDGGTRGEDPEPADAEIGRDAASDDGERTDAGAHDAGERTDAGDAACEPQSSPLDRCDGVDEDCDGEIDEDFAPGPCDGTDADLCKDGVLICTGQAGALCSDDGNSHLDMCNGLDDDCDPTSADGSDEATYGDPCDGADSDRCTEGAYACDGAVMHCSDDSADLADLCNGMDDDCDPATADGSAEPTLGDPCDGADLDLCVEGTLACTGSRLACSDETGTTIDECNGGDDDCNPGTPDGEADPRVGTACDGADADLCTDGRYACTAGGLACNDPAAAATETCNGADDDCDTKIDENIDTDPACTGAAAWGSVSGDDLVQNLTLTGAGETWRTLTIREDRTSGSALYLSAQITLTSGPGTDYDLYVYCDRCGGVEAGFSDYEDGVDVVDVRLNDDVAASDTFTVVIEVAYFDANQCSNWTLQVESNTLVDRATCN